MQMTHPQLWLRPETVLKKLDVAKGIFQTIDILAFFSSWQLWHRLICISPLDNKKTIYLIYSSIIHMRVDARHRLRRVFCCRDAQPACASQKHGGKRPCPSRDVNRRESFQWNVWARRWQRSRDGGGMERGGRDERCGVKKGMRGVKASEGRAIKSDGGRGPWTGWGSALCVAMVQAQSELLHSSVLLLS